MPVDRPTFSESWYRVAQLKPRLRSTVQIHRQHFRGQTWHVLQDPSSNQFFRLPDAGYRFVGLLDGRRAVADVWKMCNEQLGDSAPTQGEVIQLLGQLYSSNLLAAELAPDAEGLFNRYRKRVTREIQSYLTNVLFARIPIFDPDRLLDRWLSVVGWIFSWAGFFVLMAALCVGGYFVLGRYKEFASSTANLLTSQMLANNAVAMYACFIFVKIFHEFGHALACKKFGHQTGTGGEVHVMGVMFLVFTPMPYVDASSSWAFRSKWHRIVVGAAGMLVELVIASIAAVVWANTGTQSQWHALAYNVMFIASVSTLIFNANPLLRYDGYYILSDLLEIPNLAQRSKDYLYYLVKKYVWGIRQARNPAHSGGERAWFVVYGILSTIYRTVIVVGILAFVASQFWLLGMVLALASAVAWLCVPVGKFLHYLLTSPELARTRGRALATTGVTLAAIGVLVCAIQMPDRIRVTAVAEADQMPYVFPLADGFIESAAKSGSIVDPGGEPIVRLKNPELVAALEQSRLELAKLEVQHDTAVLLNQLDAATSFESAINAKRQAVAAAQKEVDDLTIHAPIHGKFIAPDLDKKLHGFARKGGEPLGMVATMDNLLVRAIATNNVAAQLMEEIEAHGTIRAEMRLEGRPDLYLEGTITRADIVQAGQEHLPSPALAATAGGTIQIDPTDRQNVKAVERFFLVTVRLDPKHPNARLLSGQRLVVRFETKPKPLAAQAWLYVQQLIQRKFEV